MLRLQEYDNRLIQLVRDPIRRHCIFEDLLEVVGILLVKDPLSYDHPGVVIQDYDQGGSVLLLSRFLPDTTDNTYPPGISLRNMPLRTLSGHAWLVPVCAFQPVAFHKSLDSCHGNRCRAQAFLY